MKKVIITFLIAILISLSTYSNGNSQAEDITDLPELSLNEKKHPNIKPADDFDNIKNFPFQFGLELGTSIFRKDDYANIGFIGSMDINLFKRAAFLRFELGVLSINDYVTSFNEGDTKAPAFASLGLNIKPIAFGKSSFFTCLSIGVVTDSWLFYVITLKYVYNVNRFLGFTSAIRYPFYGKSAFITIGLQIFTN